MALISVTRLRLRSWRYLPVYVPHAYRSARQTQRAPGYLDGAVFADRRLTFWTVTAWTDTAAMRKSVLSGAHGAAMLKLQRWCDEASAVRWEQADAALPDWHDAEWRMRAEGHPSRVRYPSPDHGSLLFAPALTIGSARLRPRSPHPDSSPDMSR